MNLSITYEQLRFILSLIDNIKNPNVFEKELIVDFLKKARKQTNMVSLRSIISDKLKEWSTKK